MLRPLAILLLLTAPALAGWPDNRFVRFTGGGTGAFVRVGDSTLILSCAHRTATVSVQVGERVGYKCGDDSHGTATVVAVYAHDPQSRPFRDAALYAVDQTPPAGMVPLALTTRDTPPNAAVWVVGFPMPAGGFSSRTTKTIGYDGALWLVGGATPGESGGPIINEYGEIIGTLTGYDDQGRTLCCPAVVLGDLFRAVKTAWCPPGRCPSSQQCPPQWQSLPQRPVPPVRRELPPPPQPLNPPMQVEGSGSRVDGQNLSVQINKHESQLMTINQQITTLQTQCAAAKPCECGQCCDKLREDFNAKLENLAAAHNELKNQLTVIQSQPSATPNYDAIAAEVGKRLTHSATVTLLDGKKKTQTKPLGEPLEFIQHSKGLK